MTFTTQTTDALCLADVKKCRTKGFRFNPLDVPQRNAWSEERATKNYVQSKSAVAAPVVVLKTSITILMVPILDP